ncbi:unnamed protein product [Auanema sp. JU1783]|nr:unnamed protein product [Auanema sp. JU1783]
MNRVIIGVYSIFSLNSTFLCICCLLYSIDWHAHIASCGTSGTVLNYSNVATAILFGIVALCCILVIIRRCLVMGRIEANIRESTFLVFLSAFSLFYTVLWGTVMLISLFFKFDLECLKSKSNKRDFELLWLLVLEAVVSGVLLLIAAVYISVNIDKSQKREDPVKLP